jgi:predicted phage-related endonuclease
MIREEYVIRTKESVFPPHELAKIHPKYSFMIANVDGIKNDGTILECKTASNPKEWGEPGTDEIPDEYLMQCAHYAIVYDTPKVDIAVLIGGNDFRIYTYHRNKDMEELIIEHESEFWHNNVLKNIPPDPIRGDDFAKAIKATKGDFKIANNNIQAIIDMLKSFKEQITSIEIQKENLMFSLKEVIGDHEGLIDDAGNILATWRFNKSTRLDINALKKSDPDIYAKYLKPSEVRVFRLKEI